MSLRSTWQRRDRFLVRQCRHPSRAGALGPQSRESLSTSVATEWPPSETLTTRKFWKRACRSQGRADTQELVSLGLAPTRANAFQLIGSAAPARRPNSSRGLELACSLVWSVTASPVRRRCCRRSRRWRSAQGYRRVGAAIGLLEFKSSGKSPAPFACRNGGHQRERSSPVPGWGRWGAGSRPTSTQTASASVLPAHRIRSPSRTLPAGRRQASGSGSPPDLPMAPDIRRR